MTLAALLPAVIGAVWTWGLPAVRVMSLCVAVAVLTEAACQKLMGRELAIDDYTAVCSGLLLSFMLPADAPWWIAVMAPLIAISLGKMAFGGLGANPVNTSVVGWAVLFVSFPLFMEPNAVQLNAASMVDPLVRLKFFGWADAGSIPLQDLLLGQQINGLGAGQVGALFLGGSLLAARGIIRWQIALGFFAGVAGLAALFCMSSPATDASPLFHLCTGSVMLGGFFLITDPANAPSRPLPMFLYGLLGGALVMTIRKYGIYLDGVPFAILLANLVAPLLDSIRPKPFGVR
jgi:electron transport complex protein RnfD